MSEKHPTIDLEQLKREVPLLSLVAASGVETKKLGNGEYAALCPFHPDKNPSLHINPIKGLFNCKGCGKSGSVVDWIMFSRGVDAGAAIRILREEFSGKRNGAAVRNVAVNDADSDPQKEPVNLLELRYQKALSLAVKYWQENFKNKNEGMEYLIRRGIVHGEIVDLFKVGYSDGSLAGVINDSDVREALEELGIIKENGREHFAGRVIFPVIDENENITQVYGRNIGRGGVKHLYLSAPHAGIYNPRGLAADTILCESIIDAISLISLGHTNVVSSFGVNGFPEDALELMESREVRRVQIAYDPDSAGDEAAEKLSGKLIARRIESYRIRFPENTDANDLLKKTEDPAVTFRELLENTVPLRQLTDEALSDADSEKNERLEKDGSEYKYRVGKRFYTIRGLENNKSDSQMKIFLRMDHEGVFHIDNNLDLFSAKGSGAFVKSSAMRTGLDERAIRGDLDRLTNALDEILKNTIKEREKEKSGAGKIEFHTNLVLAKKAREFLSDPLFIVRFVEDVEKCGLVGESLNFFFGFLSTITRGFSYQLHDIIQSESSAGKSTMLNLMAEFVPEEDMIYFTQVTPRSLYYGPPGFLKNKCIFIAEADGLKEAEFPIKQLMSEGKLSISYTKTDPQTGEHTSEVRQNEGPAQFTITEPKEGLHEEIENRSVILNLDVTAAQTEKIHDLQRLSHSPEGVLLLKEKDELTDFYRHVQREIKVYPVTNHYSPRLTYDRENHQARRDNKKYLTLMDAVTTLFQYQREKTMKAGKLCLVTHPIDIAITHFLTRRVFAKSLDELPAQTRNFVDKIVEHFSKFAKESGLDLDQIWFYRKEMRRITGLSATRVHEHTNRLVDYEYLTLRRDQNGIAYRFLTQPDGDGFFRGALKLASIDELIKYSSKKERQEYKDFIPSLEKIFKTLDPSYNGGEV